MKTVDYSRIRVVLTQNAMGQITCSLYGINGVFLLDFVAAEAVDEADVVRQALRCLSSHDWILANREAA